MEWNLDNIYTFVRGPLAWSCFIVFIVGTIFQISRFFKLSIKTEQPVFKRIHQVHTHKKKRMDRYRFAYLISRLKVSIIGTHPFMLVVTVVFHLSIFILPLFLREHNSVMDILWGASFCPNVLPHNIADIFFIIICLCMLIFLFRRVFISRVRTITSIGDLYLWVATGTPFVTGYLAIHNAFDYQMVVISHILSVEILLVSLPFTRFVHMIFFFLNRFWVRGEYGFWTARRVW